MIELRGLTHRYGSFIALDQLSLKVPKGDLHGFVGPNGAGKTTTMRILATLLKPTSGQALVDGSDVALHPRDVRRVVGYMPDFFGVYDRLKTWEYLDFYARCYGFDIMIQSDEPGCYDDAYTKWVERVAPGQLADVRTMLPPPVMTKATARAVKKPMMGTYTAFKSTPRTVVSRMREVTS